MARAYFDMSYRLLTGSGAGRRFLAQGPSGEGHIHSYFTADDEEALLSDLKPRPGDHLLDLGCGIGGIAIALNQRTGCAITGVDVSAAAISAATAGAWRTGVGRAVTFVRGDLARPPSVGATSAYAIDSLMFVPDLAEAVRRIGATLAPGGRLFATLLVRGPSAEARLRRALAEAGSRLERLDNVTPALTEQSRARSHLAKVLRRNPGNSLRGRLAMWLVTAEEAAVQAQVTRGSVSRWRLTVVYPSRTRV